MTIQFVVATQWLARTSEVAQRFNECGLGLAYQSQCAQLESSKFKSILRRRPRRNDIGLVEYYSKTALYAVFIFLNVYKLAHKWKLE